GVEALGPVGGLRLPAPRLRGCCGEIVCDVAAAEDQYALRPEITQRTGQVEVLAWRQSPIDRELYHRHVGGRVGVDEHAPGTVVEAPVAAQPRAVADHPPHACGEVGLARRGVFDREQPGWEAAEVVDRPRSFVR